MSNSSIVRARVDEEVKEEAGIILSSIGLTVSDAFRMLLFRIVREKALPFSPLIPNTTTINAMKAAKKGKFHAVASTKKLLDDLNARN